MRKISLVFVFMFIISSLFTVGCFSKKLSVNLESLVEEDSISKETSSTSVVFDADDVNLQHYRILRQGDNISGKTLYIARMSEDAYARIDKIGYNPILSFYAKPVNDGNSFNYNSVNVEFSEGFVVCTVRWGSGDNYTIYKIPFDSSVTSIKVDLEAWSGGRITDGDFIVQSTYIYSAFFDACPIYIKI